MRTEGVWQRECKDPGNISIVCVPSVESVMKEDASRYVVSATNQFLLVLTGGVISSIVCAWSTCSTKSDCESGHSCTPDTELFCTFSNKVGIYTDATYLLDSGLVDGTAERSTESAITMPDALSSMLRGLCSPGDRTQTNPQTGVLECVPFFPYPDATNREIMDPDGSTAAARACGKWMTAGNNNWLEVRGLGSHDNDKWAEQITHAEEAITASSRTATSGMAKFRAECERTATAGPAALRISAARTYSHYKNYIESTAVHADGFLRVLGYHMANYCDGPVTANVRFGTSGFSVGIVDDLLFTVGVLSSSLHLFNEPVSVKTDAEEAIKSIQNDYMMGNSQNLNTEQKKQLMIGASGNTSYSFTEVSTVFETKLIGAALEYFKRDSTKGVSYLKGLAAFCSYETYASFVSYDTDSSMYSIYSLLRGEIIRIKASKPMAETLTLLSAKASVDEAKANEIEQSTMITLASVTATSGGVGNPSVDCLAMMRVHFSEEIEEVRFLYAIPDDFYSKLQAMVTSVRVASAVVAETTYLRNTITDPKVFATIVNDSDVRYLGAPRGSWAGKARAVPRGDFSSNDGMFLMLTKQAHAQYKSNILDLVQSGSSHSKCDHRPLYAQFEWNAYATKIDDTYCSIYSLGLAHRPMLDPLYDDPSLYSRGLFIVAHEFAHFAQFSNLAGPDTYGELLKHYRHSWTHSEAYADVFAAVTVLSTGMVSRQDFYIHHCQVWCSRQPLWYIQPTRQNHPIGNDRCNFLVQTLNEFFPTLGKPPPPPPPTTHP